MIMRSYRWLLDTVCLLLLTLVTMHEYHYVTMRGLIISAGGLTISAVTAYRATWKFRINSASVYVLLTTVTVSTLKVK